MRKARALQLAGRPFRDLLYEEHAARHLEIRQPTGGKFSNTAFGTEGLPPQHHCGSDLLPQRGMRNCKRHGLGDSGMIEEDPVYLSRRDLRPGPIDHLLQTTSQEEI